MNTGSHEGECTLTSGACIVASIIRRLLILGRWLTIIHAHLLELGLHLLETQLLLLLLAQVSHWLEAYLADTRLLLLHHLLRHDWGRRFDINGTPFSLRSFSLFRAEADQVNELGTLDPGIVGILILGDILCWLLLFSFLFFLLWG